MTDIQVHSALMNITNMTEEDCEILFAAEDYLHSPSKSKFEAYCAMVKEIVEKVAKEEQKHIAKYIAKVTYKLSQVNKAAFNRGHVQISELCGLTRIWCSHYYNSRMREEVVQDVWTDPDTAIDDRQLTRDIYRNIIKSKKKDMRVADKIDAAKALEASHDTPRKKAPQHLSIGSLRGDVLLEGAQKNVIERPENIPGFMDEGPRKMLKEARKLNEDIIEDESE